ncbi:hypothetical protein [Flavobacterium sp. JP2137]|uniref:hypothetical protein n=1 Tax=Flavobacterium sp. JP2137 TaxID=3414510 RepID=UPI003D2FEEE2
MRYFVVNKTKDLIFLKGRFLTLLLFLFFSLYSTGQQLNNGAWLTWDREAGCKTYEFEPEPKSDGYLEELEKGPCLAVCENSDINFFLMGIISSK